MVARTSAATPTKADIHAIDGPYVPSFSRKTFQLYAWPTPAPTKFFQLSNSLRAWKRQQDANIPGDDGSDDWQEFAGNIDYYPDHNARAHAIGRVFVNRAKRAHLAGISWSEFEQDEMKIDSMAAAKAEKDPERKMLRMAEDLDNDLRLAVFSQLKLRLCNEVWLQIYTGKPPTEEGAGAAKEKKNSTWAVTPMKKVAVIEEEAYHDDPDRSTSGWTMDDEGAPRPLFQEHEADVPVGAKDWVASEA